ncbi:MAG TPA: acyl-CoA desaturase [Pyrinomonadaceae bacterium]|jgi:fatty acid desaturase
MTVNPTSPAAAAYPKPSFIDLKKEVQESGILKRQPFYYAYKIPLTLALLIPGIIVLVQFDNIWIQLINALFCAVAYTQIVFIGHDCGHRQVFEKSSWNDIFALFFVPTVGVSYSWWCNTHNRHHGNPNQINEDPAIEFDVFAFSERQALEKTGFRRFLIKYQSFYLIPASFLYPIHMRLQSLGYILTKKPKYQISELLLFLVHFPLYFWLVFAHLDFWTGIIFVIVHQGFFSLFLVSTFAPNHKGMIVLDDDHGMDFLHQQILTAQNVQSHPFVDFWFGGLNYQIEHHLFPRIARNKLKEAQKIVKPFCEKHSIPYYESTAPRCYWEILKFMYQVCEPLRNEKAYKSNTIVDVLPVNPNPSEE